MVHLDLHEAPDLPVYHAVELGYQHDLVAEVAVLAEELYPVHPLPGAAPVLPGARVEHQLSLVYDEQDGVLAHLATLPVVLGELYEEFGRQIVVRFVGEPLAVAPRPGVHIEISYHGAALSAKRIAYVAGGVEGLAGTGSAGIEHYHSVLLT